ncbi:asparaginase domain-containing protein [uncultured Aquimarina sp.]
MIATHGTLTMIETATFLAKQKLDKVIVLTGAFVYGSSNEICIRSKW